MAYLIKIMHSRNATYDGVSLFQNAMKAVEIRFFTDEICIRWAWYEEMRWYNVKIIVFSFASYKKILRLKGIR